MAIPVVNLGRTRVYVHLSFVLVAFVMSVTGFAWHLVVFVGSLLFHELGHAAAATLQGVDLKSIVVWPFGAIGRLERSWQLSPYAETAVALAGPLNSGLLYSAASVAERSISALQGIRAASVFPLLDLLMKLNLGLFLVNLIPCLPLDGGRILRAQLSLRCGYVSASKKVSGWGLWVGAIITAAAVWSVCRDGKGQGFLTIGPLIVWGAFEQKRVLPAENVMQILSRGDDLARRKALPVQEIVVPLDATVSEVVARFRPGRFYVMLPAAKNMRIAGRVTETLVLQAFYRGDVQLRMADLLKVE